MTSDHAPWSDGRALAMRSSQVPPGALAIACATTSVSEEVVNGTPWPASSSRISRALMQLPLWPIASSPSFSSCTTKGCAFWIFDEPVVE